MTNKNVYIFGGGTVAHIANHLAVCAPAYGSTAKRLETLVRERFEDNVNVVPILTRMAGGHLETNEHVAKVVDSIRQDPNTMVVFFNCALVDFIPAYLNSYKETREDISGKDSLLNQEPNLFLETFDKYAGRLETRESDILEIGFVPSNKIISTIRENRKDIFVVGFKTTCGSTRQEMFEKGLRLLKEGHVNLCLVNDTKTRWNMIVTPEEATYHETQDRDSILKELVDIAYFRSHLKFTQSNVVDGKPVSWNDDRVPSSLREVVNYCIARGAYKEFNGATVGHFAVKVSDNEFLTSIRRSNFNDLPNTGLVYVKTDGPDTVTAYGAKPSVGGQSQRIVFRDHPGMDCIVHFHCPFKSNHIDDIPVRSQREVECGSHQCGKNTSGGLKQFGNLKAVMLDNHGPNIVFNRNIDPQEVINFIDRNFDLSGKTGGYII